MSIHQLNINGMDMVEVAIKRLQTFEPEEGYFLAFSGGKDSVVVKALADMAQVKYDAHYAITSVDPPELVQFVKTFPDVIRERQYWKKDGLYHKAGDPITMWNLIPEKKMPPTRIARYCCAYLKESQGEGRFVVTGVRKAESAKRAKSRGGLETAEKKSQRRDIYDPDNPTPEMFYHCKVHSRRVLNPIYDWTTEEVWEFIKEYNVPYCELYDKGYTRLGCIGCPMSTKNAEELEKYPKFKQAYIRAFQRMVDNMDGIRNKTWTDGEGVYKWWLQQ